MITEDYVSFETAKLLKKKGFNEVKCQNSPHFAYNKDGRFSGPSWDTEYNAPTLQMAMKWLREVHKIEIWIHYDIDKTTWWGGCNPMYEEDEENSSTFQSLLSFDYPGKTYEEACEAAIKYCLENLL